jgi:uncharacterized protein (DUF1684 family)
MLKYILCYFLLISTAFAQKYEKSIAKHRESYKAAFLKETRSPLKEEDFEHLHFFNADPRFNVKAKIEVITNQKPFQMPTYDGTSKEFIKYAKVFFQIDGQDLQLTLYRNTGLMINPIYKDLLFLPFTDLSTNKTTYGGGRYIDLNIKTIKKGFIPIDFNKAYNPYCAYSDGYRCPVPPEENDLPIAIFAGEQKYTGEKKHQ